MINVNNKRNKAPYTKADMRLLQAIAGHAAVALSNARRYEEMEARAQRDALTNLANHGFFWSTIEAEVKRADRHGRQLSLAMIDVDAFKAFNDRFGHRQGDSALVSVSTVIANTSRAHDLAARYGGEEFAVILTETALEGAEVFAEKIRAGVESLAEHDLTVSVGVESPEARRQRGRAGGARRRAALPRQGPGPKPRLLFRFLAQFNPASVRLALCWSRQQRLAVYLRPGRGIALDDVWRRAPRELGPRTQAGAVT